MDRRTLLSGTGLLFSIPFGGCLADPTLPENTDEEGSEGENDDENERPISEQFDCADAIRPEPDVPAGVEQEVTIDDETTVHESVGSTDYPTPPPEFDDDVRGFLEEHERAYQRNEAAEKYGERLVELEVMMEGVELFDEDDEIVTVRLDFAVHFVVVDDGGLVTTEPAGEAAVYAVDDTGFVRTEADYREMLDGSIREETPDPLEEGTIVGCF